VTPVLILVHLGVGAVWLGGMLYSLFVVQPRIPRVLPDPVRAEDLYRELGAGNRWRVVGLIGVLALSGLLLLYIQSGHSSLWWAVVAAKVLLLVAASVLFWWVSWRGWPRRVFALPEELPAEQARFRRVALAMAGLVGIAFFLGIAASHALT
jgi:Flp pilus assembly protein TadB